MPNPADLAAYARNDGPPDPAGAKTREATLTLGTTDIRYRGYLDGIETAIDLSWSQRWKEALLAAGRAGSVVVRFTLTPGGNIESVEVVKGSGSSILDDEASNAVRRAPLPPFPAHWTIDRLHLLAQFDYRFE
jgi:TonB family protein